MNILILGGSGGIGREVIKQFCQTKGNFIYYTYTSWTNELQGLNQFIIDTGNRPIPIHFIIGDGVHGDWKNDFENFLPVLPEIDYFINCVGILRDRTLAKMSDAELYDVININLFGTINACKVILPHMKDGGCIINIGSVIGDNGNFGQTVYSASKAGLEGFTKSLAIETAKRKIRVNLVVPSIVDTYIFKKLTNEQRLKLADRTLFKRFATPEEIAKLIRFICVDGTFFSGDIIPIKNGFV